MEPGSLIQVLLILCIIGIFAAAVIQGLFLLKLLASVLISTCWMVSCL